MRFARLAKVAAAIVVTSCFTARAEAAYDMSDKWLVSPSGLRFDLTQSDGTVGGTADGRTVAGTIDETTGEFHLRFGNSFPCPVDFFDGNIAAGNESFTATWTHVQLVVISRFDIRCSSDTSTQSGTRCGNNQIDFGEDCDDGGVADGDCCSSSCTFDDPGTLCTTDYDVCTDDVCDGAGTCEHPDNSAPCADPNGCATGACNAGACVLTTNMTAGTPCDFDSSVCTIDDACDGAGQCAPGAAMDCSPCGMCDAVEGCVYSTVPACDEDLSKEILSIELADDPSDDRLGLRIVDDVVASGDPTSSTSYTMCIYSYVDGISRPVMSATIPAGGSCDGENCWTPRGAGYVYKDRSGSADGVTAMRVGPAGFRLTGRGANLPLPDGLLSQPRLSARIIVDDGLSQACWFHWLGAKLQSTAEYKGTYHR
ncbi:MAG TPA: hypothetical protein VN634_16275 [Candidatus Limnocylindrales bacterium]|nr:hypothetical protein [Candidatus Limnocylindrales bacterium]